MADEPDHRPIPSSPIENTPGYAVPPVEEAKDLISFHLGWAEIDPTVSPLLSDVTDRSQWFYYERDGHMEDLFLHTVAVGAPILERALQRHGFTRSEGLGVVSRGLYALSLAPPFDSLPLQAATVAQMAFDRQMRQESPVTMGEVTIFAAELNPEHLLSATQAAFGLVLTLLRACAHREAAPGPE